MSRLVALKGREIYLIWRRSERSHQIHIAEEYLSEQRLLLSRPLCENGGRCVSKENSRRTERKTACGNIIVKKRGTSAKVKRSPGKLLLRRKAFPFVLFWFHYECRRTKKDGRRKKFSVSGRLPYLSGKRVRFRMKNRWSQRETNSQESVRENSAPIISTICCGLKISSFWKVSTIASDTKSETFTQAPLPF